MRLPGQRRDLQQLAGRLYARLFTYAPQKPPTQLQRAHHSTQITSNATVDSDSSPDSLNYRSSSVDPTRRSVSAQPALPYPVTSGSAVAISSIRSEDIQHPFPNARTRRLKPSLRSRAPTSGPVVSSTSTSIQPTSRLTFEDQLQLARIKKSHHHHQQHHQQHQHPTTLDSSFETNKADNSQTNPTVSQLFNASQPHFLPSSASTTRLATSGSVIAIPTGSIPSESVHQQHHSYTMPSSVNICSSIERLDNAMLSGPPDPRSSLTTSDLRNSKYNRKRSIIGFDSTDIVEDPALCAVLLTVISLVLIVCSLPFSLFFCIKVVQEYERAVIFRLGRLVTGGARGPGIFFIIPCIDTYSKVDLRTVSFDVPPQEILSKDSVTVAVDAVVYFRINNAIASVSNVEDYARSTRLLAATTLRNVLGTKNLSEILSERESISHMIQSSLDEATESWGVKVERVEIKDVRLPVLLQRAMAAEAEATREARAKVIAAEGEQRASRALKEAAEVISDSPAALQLRYLQTLSSIAAENNSTIVFPVPMELFRGFTNHVNDRPPSPHLDSYGLIGSNAACSAGIASGVLCGSDRTDREMGDCDGANCPIVGTPGPSAFPPPMEESIKVRLPNQIVSTELDISVEQILRADLESPSISKYKD